jgi:hypothetical protein
MTMKYASIALAALIGIMLLGVVITPVGVRAHEQETSVDWEVAYANIRTTSVPQFTHTTTLPPPSGAPAVSGVGPGYPTIEMRTGDYLVITWGFHYVGKGRSGSPIRGDLFWITRLGLDFGTVGRYINNEWIGGGSFELVPNAFYNATLVVRSIQPTLRHLHVGVSVQDVGNIPAAPTLTNILPGGPILYGVFTSASGPVAEPLGGMTIAPFGQLNLIATWPWAAASVAAQIVIGLAFIGIMYWYGRWESKRGAKA